MVLFAGSVFMSTDTHLEADFMFMSAAMLRGESRTVLRSEGRSTKLCMRVNNRLLGWTVSKHPSEGDCQAGGVLQQHRQRLHRQRLTQNRRHLRQVEGADGPQLDQQRRRAQRECRRQSEDVE